MEGHSAQGRVIMPNSLSVIYKTVTSPERRETVKYTLGEFVYALDAAQRGGILDLVVLNKGEEAHLYLVMSHLEYILVQ